ncbi:MAG: EboA domain-containing protein [Planctomycetota bacterium]
MHQNSSCEQYSSLYQETYRVRLVENGCEALSESVLGAAENTKTLSELIEVWAKIGLECGDSAASEELRNGDENHAGLMELPLKDMMKSMALEKACKEWGGSSEGFTRLLERLYQTADVREKRLIILVLPLLRSGERFLRVATEAARTNILPVFSALALGNPFPQEHFSESQWNQMVLKAIFVGCNIREIVGLHERHNSSLSETIFQYVSERHSARRSVPPSVVELCERALSDASQLQLNSIKPGLSQE